MGSLEPTEIICVFGVRGSGKTTWIRNYVAQKSCLLVYDFLSQFSVGYVRIHEWEALKEYFAQAAPENFRVSFIPVYDIQYFDLCCTLVKHLGKSYGHICFVIDEVDRYCKPNWEPEGFTEIISQGRHYNVSLIVASRTPAEISKLITSQATKFVCFTTHEDRHVDYLVSHMGEKAVGLKSQPFYRPIIHDFSGGFSPQSSEESKVQKKESNHII